MDLPLVMVYFQRCMVPLEPGRVEAGNYYMRLICTNGQMARVNDKTARTNQLDASSMRNMLSLPQYDGFTKRISKKSKNNALLAMQTDASVGGGADGESPAETLRSGRIRSR